MLRKWEYRRRKPADVVRVDLRAFFAEIGRLLAVYHTGRAHV